MEYFHLGIFVIPRVHLIRNYGSQTQAFFFRISQIFRHRMFFNSSSFFTGQIQNSYKDKMEKVKKVFSKTFKTSKQCRGY